MKLPLLLLAAASSACVLVAQPAPAPAPAPAHEPAHAHDHPKLTPEEAAADREKHTKEVLEAIAGRENEPAEKVFKNIQKLKGVPAGRIPRIMNTGFGRSLGVGCAHCHVEGEWDKEDKPQLQITREMMDLSRKISGELLPAIKNLESEKPVVNCTTCHRGEVKPATDLPDPAPRPRAP